MNLSRSSLQNSMRLIARDEHGNVAVIFVVALIPLLGLVGAAVDYSRANAARTAMQSALDSTALMITKDSTTLSADQVQSRAKQYFNALYTNTEAPASNFSVAYTPDTGKGATVQVSADGAIKTDFLKVLGPSLSQLPVRSSSTTTWGRTKLRVAMALDNTGSMDKAGKMTALKTAAKNLVDTLSASAKDKDDVMIAIVPFAKDVNVGKSNNNANWLRWDLSICKNSSTNAVLFTTQSDCNSRRSYAWTPPPTKSNWNGCVTDRTADYDTTNTTPTASQIATLFPVEQIDPLYPTLPGFCPQQPITQLTNQWTTLKNNIDAMTPNGGTNQSIGVAWAWLSLLSQSPLNAPSQDANYNYNNVIILLSDGDNTQYRDPSYGNGNQQSSCGNSTYGCVDQRQQKLCDNIKAAKDSKGKPVFTIFTIQVNTDGSATRPIMKYCASDSSKFFSTTTSAGINTAFDAIAASLSQLRIAQ